MINQEKLPEYIKDNMPELSAICSKKECRNPYDVAQQMLKYAKKQLANHNLKGVQKCLQLAEGLYNKGNFIIRNAIDNVFVYSFSHAFFHDEAKKKELMTILPSSLHDLYKKQVIYSHL